VKKILKKILHNFGYDILRIEPFPPGTPQRPIGRMDYLIADLKARGLSCKLIMDIGANQADWSKMAKKFYPEAKFCLIEPQIEMKERLESFCNGSNQSVYFIAGADKKSGTKYLTVYDDLAGSTFLPFETDQLKEIGKQRAVEMIAVDDIIESGQCGIPDLVKLDVQGYELEALKGASKLFGKTEVFILEVSLFSFDDCPGMPILSEVLHFMAERDYVAYDFPGFMRRPLDGALGQCDICFVKNDGFLRSSNGWGQ
jgi:FkbM family methyltransferase